MLMVAVFQLSMPHKNVKSRQIDKFLGPAFIDFFIVRFLRDAWLLLYYLWSC